MLVCSRSRLSIRVRHAWRLPLPQRAPGQARAQGFRYWVCSTCAKYNAYTGQKGSPRLLGFGETGRWRLHTARQAPKSGCRRALLRSLGAESGRHPGRKSLPSISAVSRGCRPSGPTREMDVRPHTLPPAPSGRHWEPREPCPAPTCILPAPVSLPSAPRPRDTVRPADDTRPFSGALCSPPTPVRDASSAALPDCRPWVGAPPPCTGGVLRARACAHSLQVAEPPAPKSALPTRQGPRKGAQPVVLVFPECPAPRPGAAMQAPLSTSQPMNAGRNECGNSEAFSLGAEVTSS